MAVCRVCAKRFPGYYVNSSGLCDDCTWDTWIPKGYQKREMYAYDSFWGHSNATCRPPLGVEFLDVSAPRASAVLRLPPNMDERVRLAVEYMAIGHTQAEAAEMAGMAYRTLQRSLQRLRIFLKNDGAKPGLACSSL